MPLRRRRYTPSRKLAVCPAAEAVGWTKRGRPIERSGAFLLNRSLLARPRGFGAAAIASMRRVNRRIIQTETPPINMPHGRESPAPFSGRRASLLLSRP